jgi:phenylacetate-CoA ligase
MAASARGYYLHWWRYGPETEALIQEAFDRESWSSEQWIIWQEERLAFLLHRAASRVPYYRDQWSRRRQKGDRVPWEYLENWPVLEKEDLRTNPKAFVADDCRIRSMFHEHTSGTSGKPLDLWWSHNTVRQWYALFEARWRRWYGVCHHDPWAILGGQLIVPVKERRPPFWVWNSGLNQLYMSSYHLSPDLIPFYLEALQRYRVKYLWGYTSSLYSLAQEILNSRRSDLTMTVVVTNAEPLFDYQREAIGAAFQCPVRETYGMAEIVSAASECNEGNLHLWPEVGRVEVLQDDSSLTSSGLDNLVCTGLLNADMPLIRYRTGDTGSLAGSTDICRCGRKLPLLASVDGRCDDILYTPDGMHIGRLDPVFKTKLPIREAQIIQDKLNLIRVLYVPTQDFRAKDGYAIIDNLQQRLGAVEIILEPVPQIPLSAAGKFRAVICNLPPEEKLKLLEVTHRKQRGTSTDSTVPCD